MSSEAPVTQTPRDPILALAGDVTAAYVSNNSVPAAELPTLLGTIFQTLSGLVQLGQPQPEAEARQPAVPIKKSVQPDHIVCLEDGKTFKSLKRHLKAKYNLTPDQYRERWGLPADYPMVAPSYSAARSQLARSLGLGHVTTRHKGGATDESQAAGTQTPQTPQTPQTEAAPKGRGRKAATAEAGADQQAAQSTTKSTTRGAGKNAAADTSKSATKSAKATEAAPAKSKPKGRGSKAEAQASAA